MKSEGVRNWKVRKSQEQKTIGARNINEIQVSPIRAHDIQKPFAYYQLLNLQDEFLSLAL